MPFRSRSFSDRCVQSSGSGIVWGLNAELERVTAGVHRLEDPLVGLSDGADGFPISVPPRSSRGADAAQDTWIKLPSRMENVMTFMLMCSSYEDRMEVWCSLIYVVLSCRCVARLKRTHTFMNTSLRREDSTICAPSSS